MTRVKFTVAYDGTDFCGWQRQNHGHIQSVAHTLELGLKKVFKGEDIGLFASGRTDAGVHAFNQVCHFDTESTEADLMNWDLGWALKSYLPPSIVVKNAWIAPREFHATISAEAKTYKYLIWNHTRPNPILIRYSDWYRFDMNVDYLNECCQYILGEHDFKSFQSVGTEMKSTVRTIHYAQWRWRKKNFLEFTINGSGFLKQMVRNIVGTQLLLMRKGLPANEIRKIMDQHDRTVAGAPGAPQGLYLMKVYYPPALDAQCKPMFHIQY